ncbi:MAG: branched-chain amino acid aminotransferase [Candidatus Margulisbacteria bacterium]|nr:branched-chain amino acid aminotransferase [Candidatus Margulisiibacteriota bacterium]MBU1021706.1 branched-chain amino acid aminotransferase [Candidatus Margulisiibacteriota bacterium]MBU1729452.1 branched-chain amino acid aminotransferase [Candidatus Margulisiibacteriota bacterium]MBU1955447.1 branched-chain amino acid aminotransferase [Candidatus Margulisiibacteriota bacterium]
MGKLVVKRVEVRGTTRIGCRTRMGYKAGSKSPAVREMKREGLGIQYHVTDGTNHFIAQGRLDDFRHISLEPSLHPNAVNQTFVDGPVLRRAQEVLEQVPQVRGRLQLVQKGAINFDGLSFSITPTDAMFKVTIPNGDVWPASALVPFDHIEISPAAGALNYGQQLFEGMKALNTPEGNVVLFRPKENAKRAIDGAKRLGLTSVPVDYFLNAVTRVVRANRRWIPPHGKGALYIRPLLIGSGPIVGVAPAPENTFMVFVTPVGPYFKGGLTAIDLIVSEKNHRAAPGGSGSVKAGGNYAPGMMPAKEAKAAGFAEVIYLDAQEHKYVEEVGAANFFCICGNTIHTPKLTGTILPGITRASVIQIARDLGYEVIEHERVPIDFVMQNATAAFCTGTAAVISPIGSITHGDIKKIFNNGEVDPTVRILYEALTAIQTQQAEDRHGWVFPVAI